MEPDDDVFEIRSVRQCGTSRGHSPYLPLTLMDFLSKIRWSPAARPTAPLGPIRAPRGLHSNPVPVACLRPAPPGARAPLAYRRSCAPCGFGRKLLQTSGASGACPRLVAPPVMLMAHAYWVTECRDEDVRMQMRESVIPTLCRTLRLLTPGTAARARRSSKRAGGGNLLEMRGG